MLACCDRKGMDLGNLPRVPDPENPSRRWVYLCNTQEEAQQFVDELQEDTGQNGWRVEPTTATPSYGPFGPVLLQLSRQSDGLAFALQTLSQAMIEETFPDLTPAATSIFIDMQTWNNFQKKRGNLSDLVKEIVPSLTGLTMKQLTDIGYAVIDADDNRTWVYVPPVGTAQRQF